MLIYLVLQFRMRVESFLLEIMLIVLILHTVLNYHHFNLLQLQVFEFSQQMMMYILTRAVQFLYPKQLYY